jgi:Phosphotransferase enzyme family
VGAPRLYAAYDTGAVLVEFVPGETLAAVAGRGELGDREWHLAGEAYRQIHAVRFLTTLRGDFGPDRLELTLTDPVDLLNAKVDAAEPAIWVERPGLMPLLDVLRERINARATDLRAEAPCLVHTDANFHNLILAMTESLIDRDHPAERYPSKSWKPLEEPAYLNGISELSNAFFARYGRQVSCPLLRLHRIIGWAAGAETAGEVKRLLSNLASGSACGKRVIHVSARPADRADHRARRGSVGVRSRIHRRTKSFAL